MRLSSIPSPLFTALFFLFFSCGRIPQRTDPSFPILSDGLSLEQACFLISRHAMTVCGGSDTTSLKSFFHILDSTAAALGESLADKKPASAGADSIVNCVYAAWGIGFDPRDTMLETLLPHLVYKNKKGACLGVSLIMLVLAEKLGCPVYGVMLPGHFFCRYESAAVRFNIEPNKAGFRHPDEYYRDRYAVASRPWYDLSNLTKTAVIGVHVL